MNNYLAISISVFDKQTNVINSIFAYLLLAIFVVFLMLTIFVSGFYKNRRYFLLFAFGINLSYFGVVLFLQKPLALAFIPVGLSAILFGILCVLPKKRDEDKEKLEEYSDILQKDAEQISRPCAKNNEQQGIMSNAEQFLQKIKCQQEEENVEIPASQPELKNGIDFSHVISILNKLTRFGLSENDSKIIEELKESLNQANEGNCSIELKTKINDGLSALLKIMAKYSL